MALIIYPSAQKLCTVRVRVWFLKSNLFNSGWMGPDEGMVYKLAADLAFRANVVT